MLGVFSQLVSAFQLFNGECIFYSEVEICLLSDTYRTSRGKCLASAFDPKETFAFSYEDDRNPD